MRASVVLFALLPALASAHLVSRQTPTLPDCATTCVDQLGAGCAPGDIACICSDPGNVANIQACLPTVCSGDDLQNAQAAGLAICEAVGVSQTIPGASGTATSAATGTDATDTATDATVSALDTSAATNGTSTAARTSAATTGATTHAVTSSIASTARPTTGTTGSSGNSTSHATSANSTSTSHGAGYPAATHVVGALMGGLVVVGGAVIGL